MILYLCKNLLILIYFFKDNCHKKLFYAVSNNDINTGKLKINTSKLMENSKDKDENFRKISNWPKPNNHNSKLK